MKTMTAGVATLVVALCMSAVPKAMAGPINSRADLDNLLGNNEVLEDFENYDIANGMADLLFTTTLDSNSVVNGQGPGLVQQGAQYVDATETNLQWNGDGYNGVPTKTLLAYSSNGRDPAIEIDYTTFVQAMGIDIHEIEGASLNGTAYFYDATSNHHLLGSTPFTITNGGAETAFVGWQYGDGIGKVVITSPDFEWSPLIDNHAYGRYANGPVTIDVTGRCPGQITLEWNNAAPDTHLGLLFSFDTGHFLIPAGPCSGVYLGLGSSHTQVVGSVGTGHTGSGSVSGHVTSFACQHYLQAIEVPSCTTSNVVQIP